MTIRNLLIISLSLGLALALFGCCCGGGGSSDWDDWSTDTGLDSDSWGKIKATQSTTIYASPSDTAASVGTLSQGDKVEYYGWDDSFNYYKVKTADGSDGYVKLLEAEIVFE